MKKEVLALLLPLFADWEVAFTASALNSQVVAFTASNLNKQIQNTDSKYYLKTVGYTKEPIKSIGGLTILPDYDIENISENYAALLLIGGMSWCTKDRKQTKIAKKVIPLVQTALKNQKIVGAICDATTFLGANGWLNKINHTSNTLSDLIAVAAENYTNQSGYCNQQAVRDKNIITANGTAYLEFTKEIIFALNTYEKNDIERYYDFYKKGYYQAILKDNIAKGI